MFEADFIKRIVEAISCPEQNTECVDLPFTAAL